MNKLRNFLRRIRLVRRRSSTLTKCVVLATLVLATVAVILLNSMRLDAKERQEKARKDMAVAITKNEELKENIAILGTVDSIEQIAEDVLGLVYPDTIIFETN